MFWNRVLVTILCGAFSAANPLVTTTSTNGASTEINHFTVQINLTEQASVNVGLENVCDSILTPEYINIEQSSTKYNESLLEQTLMHSHILRRIFGFLKSNELQAAEQVCKRWSSEVDDLERLRDINKLVFLGFSHLATGGSQRRLLQRYNRHVQDERGEEQVMWRPKLTMIFRFDPDESFQTEINPHSVAMKCIDDVTEAVLRGSSTLIAGSMWETAIDVDLEYAKQMLSGLSRAIVFPEALLARPNVHVKVIFPTLDMLKAGFNLSVANPEQNKQMFEELFGWKKEHPIKCAIVISRSIPDDIVQESARKRLEETCRLLKSLPEASNMPICAVDNFFTEESDFEMRSDGPVAVVLFGGEAVQATDFSSSNYFASIGEFEQWKVGEFKCLSNAAQTIAFYMDSFTHSDAPALFRSVFGNEIPYVLLRGQSEVFAIRKTKTNLDEAFNIRFSSSSFFLIIGFE